MPDFKIWENDEARLIAQRLIREHHQHLVDHPLLGTARILYLFTDRKRKKGNKVTLGTAQKLPGLQRYISREEGDETTEVDFILLFSWLEWEILEDDQRVALVDHELCHCVIRKGAWAIREHDVEEFAEVIERHGLWKSDLTKMAQAMRQLPLPGVRR